MRVLVGISGGLDSAYAVLKLRAEGHEVEGAVLVMHEHTETDAARRAAALLNLPLHVIDCTEAFDRAVKENFAKEYALGRTPNPCVVCNREVKLKELYKYAVANGFDRIATGHYSEPVRVTSGNRELITLKMSRDKAKDQTYMLSMCESEILAALLLPLSDMTKAEIRDEVARLGLSHLDRPESQEICFLPDGDYPSFVEERTGKFPEGDFVSEDGRILGRHKGIIHYTVGQRKGLGVSHTSRLFVTKIDPVSNNITLSEKKNESRVIYIKDVNYLGIPMPTEPLRLRASMQHRYRSRLTSVIAELYPDGRGTVYADESVSSVTPGQTLSLYDGEMLLLGAIIDRAE